LRFCSRPPVCQYPERSPLSTSQQAPDPCET
jgi:hypothetical protein